MTGATALVAAGIEPDGADWADGGVAGAAGAVGPEAAGFGVVAVTAGCDGTTCAGTPGETAGCGLAGHGMAGWEVAGSAAAGSAVGGCGAVCCADAGWLGAGPGWAGAAGLPPEVGEVTAPDEGEEEDEGDEDEDEDGDEDERAVCVGEETVCVTEEVRDPAAWAEPAAPELAAGDRAGVVPACAWRENTTRRTSSPAATRAACTARRATCRSVA